MKYLLPICLALSIISSPAFSSDQEDEDIQPTGPAANSTTTQAEDLDDLDEDAFYDAACAVCRGVKYAFGSLKLAWDALNQEDEEVVTADLHLAMLLYALK